MITFIVVTGYNTELHNFISQSTRHLLKLTSQLIILNRKKNVLLRGFFILSNLTIPLKKDPNDLNCFTCQCGGRIFRFTGQGQTWPAFGWKNGSMLYPGCKVIITLHDTIHFDQHIAHSKQTKRAWQMCLSFKYNTNTVKHPLLFWICAIKEFGFYSTFE